MDNTRHLTSTAVADGNAQVEWQQPNYRLLR
jgi:hypothetical protein